MNQIELLSFIAQYKQENNKTPSLKTMAEHFCVKNNRVNEQIQNLIKAGKLYRDPITKELVLY